jgi:DNA-binding NarL/FixJ family response regulator
MNGKTQNRGRPTKASPIFFVVEDQVMVREFLCRDLQAVYPGCTINQAGSLAEIRTFEQKNTRFDLAIVDIELPDGSALEWVQQAVQTRPGQRILILSARDEDYVLFQAMHSSIPGYVHKNDKPEVLQQAIKAVLDGGMFYSQSVLQMCRKQQADPKFFNKLLTAREQEALELFGGGLPDGEVAALIGISPFTAASYRKQIMTKLGVHSQGELMKYAVSKGFSQLH